MEAERQQTGPLAVGKKAKMPDADEALRERVQEKAPQELVGRQAHESLFVLVRGIAPAKGNLAIRERDQSAIGYGDAVSVSAKIPHDVFGPAKRALAVDDPVIAEELPQPSRERFRTREEIQLPMETESPLAVDAFEPGHKLAAKDAAQDLHGQEECVAGVDPARPVGG